MIDFCDGELLHIIPENFKNNETIALSYVIKRAMNQLQTYIKASAIYSSIEKLPEPVLDLMAVEFNTQYYDQKMTRNMKEQLIIRTQSWYLLAGTPFVLMEFLETVYDGGNIEEWFDYQGDPYCFKVNVKIGEQEVDQETIKRIRKQILQYKNVRSKLECMIFHVGNHFLIEIKYINMITINSYFYPRYNQEHLTYNGDSNWNGTYEFNGYKMGAFIDFYPVSIKLDNNIRIPIELAASLLSYSFFMEKVSLLSIISNQSFAAVASDLQSLGVDLQHDIGVEHTIDSRELQVSNFSCNSNYNLESSCLSMVGMAVQIKSVEILKHDIVNVQMESHTIHTNHSRFICNVVEYSGLTERNRISMLTGINSISRVTTGVSVFCNYESGLVVEKDLSYYNAAYSWDGVTKFDAEIINYQL